ncbi:outer membrane murein-binding lipoprotein Lpp [Oikeobacillus pervagus]|uniref:Outer membrane murein-binding lipoprotein Lpp n=1 Tax=Oikeobacillus pervagus TaxID=1325931 RepID=A0AAJ1T3Q7_9BACI|nr:hypothetical protein [Oikeobacillus pervagus]MDQ0214671.1 outer membrane murein-binding lipoprotein Lpp [Oikeobacillus pervagus]
MSDQLLQQILEELKGLKEDVIGLKADVGGLKQDVSSLKQDVNGLKRDVSTLNSKVQNLDSKVSGIDDKVNKIEHEQQKGNERITSVFNQTGKLSEYHAETIAHLEQVATLEDLEYIYMKLGEHDREIFKMKNRA